MSCYVVSYRRNKADKPTPTSIPTADYAALQKTRKSRACFCLSALQLRPATYTLAFCLPWADLCSVRLLWGYEGPCSLCLEGSPAALVHAAKPAQCMADLTKQGPTSLSLLRRRLQGFRLSETPAGLSLSLPLFLGQPRAFVQSKSAAKRSFRSLQASLYSSLHV